MLDTPSPQLWWVTQELHNNGGADDDTITLDLQGAQPSQQLCAATKEKILLRTLSGVDATASSLNLGTNAGDDTIELVSNTSSLGFAVGGGADDDKITLSGGAYTDSTIAGGFGRTSSLPTPTSTRPSFAWDKDLTKEATLLTPMSAAV